jgi:TRAP-type C4-dicarboxylate transport system permease large subunit
MIFFIILGCFLDGISMVVLTMAVILPTIVAAGIDLIWFGVFLVLVVEMAQITPPVGFNLFVLQGMTSRASRRRAARTWHGALVEPRPRAPWTAHVAKMGPAPRGAFVTG